MVRDQWAAGTTYEDFMGRWSRRLAPVFLSWLGLPRGVHRLDVGCGTGSLAHAICAHADPASVVGCDPALPLLDFAREHGADARASFVAAGVGSLPRRPGGYGSVTSLLARNSFPDPEAAVRDMRAVAAPQATVSACVWDDGEGMSHRRTPIAARRCRDDSRRRCGRTRTARSSSRPVRGPFAERST